MTSGPLDPKVGEALCDDNAVVDVMQHPKMQEALKVLKEDPSAYHNLVAADPELNELFGKLRGMMEEKEKAVPKGPTAPRLDDDGVPTLAEGPEAEAEVAKVEGTAAFEAGDYDLAAARYERAAALQPAEPIYWSNLAVARLRAGKAEASAEAARESTRLNPRFAKGWLRLGEAQIALGDTDAAVDAFESGLQRAEGAIRIALTKAIQKAKTDAATAKAVGSTTVKPKKSGASCSDAAAAAAPEPPPPAPKPAPKPLPTVADEKRVAAETEALRRRTDDQMRKYAEMAKEQTKAAATVVPKAAPPPTVARKAVPIEEVGSDDDLESDEEDAPRIVDITEEPKAARPKIVDVTPPPATGAAPASDDTPAASADEEPAPAADNLFAAALEQWSETRPRDKAADAIASAEAKAPGPAPASKKADKAPAKKPPVMPLSNNLIFDLA